MSGARYTAASDAGPGPGAYEVNKSYKTVYNSRPNTVFSSGARMESKAADGPDPGTYYMPRPQTGGITMKGRYKDKLDDRSPGPAAYDQKYRTIQNMVDTSKPIGTSPPKRNYMRKSDSPGPGQYLIPEKYEKGPKFGRESK